MSTHPCIREILLSLAVLWRGVAVVCFGGSIVGGLLINLPGRPVLLSDLIWLAATGAVLMVVHVVLLALGNSSRFEDHAL